MPPKRKSSASERLKAEKEKEEEAQQEQHRVEEEAKRAAEQREKEAEQEILRAAAIAREEQARALQGAHIMRDAKGLCSVDVTTPFRNMQDALDRLLPFHVRERDCI